MPALLTTTLLLNDTLLFYHNLTHHIIPGPQSLSYFLPILLPPTALLFPPSTISHRGLRIYVLPVIYVCLLHAFHAIGGVDVISISAGLWATVLLGFKDVRRDFVRVRWRQGDKGLEVQEDCYPEGFGLKRVQWVLTLMVSLRFTGWKIGEVRHDKWQPAKRQLSRTQYLRHALSIPLLGYLLLDASFGYVRYDAYFTTGGMGVDAPFAPSSSRVPWAVARLQSLLPPRVLRSAILAAQVFGMVSGGFYLATFLPVFLNAVGMVPDEWSPHNWPTFFGSFSAVYERGLRGLWGSWWHQMDRGTAGEPGRSLARLLRLPKSSVVEYVCVVTAAFFLTGLMHTGMIPAEPLSRIMSATHMRLFIGGFFWSQVPGIAVEAIVARVVARYAPSLREWRVSRAVALIWVALWLCLTLPLIVPPFREIGYWRVGQVPVSVLGTLARFW